MTRLILKTVAIISLIFLIIYFLKDINLPFIGPFGNNNATYSIQAKNYLKLGLLETNFAPINSLPGEPRVYYLHHPPLLQLLTAFSYKIFGENEFWPGRFFPILATILSVLLLGLIAKEIWGEKEKWLAIFFASSSPFLLSFGKIIQFESILLFFVLLFYWLYLRFQKHQNKKIKIILILLTILASLTDWVALVFFLIIGIVHCSKTKKNGIWYFSFISAFTLFIFLIYVIYLTGSSDIFNAYFGRSIGSELFAKSFAFIRLTLLVVIRLLLYFSPLVIVTSSINLFKEKNQNLLIFLFFGLANILLFPNGAFSHPYWLYCLTSFFILGSARFTSLFFQKKEYKPFFVVTIIFNLIFSIAIINLKDQQVKKALWENNFIDQINEVVTDNKTIATSWDFNEELFRYKTEKPIKIYWSKEEIEKYILEKPKFDYFIFSCWANCTVEDAKIGNELSQKYKEILIEENRRAILFDLNSATNNKPSANHANPEVISKPEENKIIFYYRKLRDKLGVSQI